MALRLDDFTWELICDNLDELLANKVTKKEFLFALKNFVNFQMEIAEGVGYSEGYYKRTDEGLKLVNDPNYIPDRKLASGGGYAKLVDLTEEDTWRDMLKAEERMSRQGYGS